MRCKSYCFMSKRAFNCVWFYRYGFTWVVNSISYSLCKNVARFARSGVYDYWPTKRPSQVLNLFSNFWNEKYCFRKPKDFWHFFSVKYFWTLSFQLMWLKQAVQFIQSILISIEIKCWFWTIRNYYQFITLQIKARIFSTTESNNSNIKFAGFGLSKF